ncbi:uncharacterized protein PV09_02201 [Verruconis gallopava]|uniref:Uncharacterized protein n=1 Tax=Verruconis gallopava TaxID=253628 RepID=A0A0D2ALG5_9PEZI|nr:uncharacterized protein PV09_02201 [Verruconis gallopava]KIW07355.1 hypothetical protein PV09_02201 [Verruconis gallopava]
MVGSSAEQASTSATRRAVGYSASVVASRNRLSSLAQAFPGAFLSQLRNLWSDRQPVTSRRSNSAVSETDPNTSSVQLTGSASNIVASHLPLVQRPAKSNSSNVSISSRPVVVKTYTQVDRSRPSSASTSTRGQARSMTTSASLPPVDAFSFDGILRAIEPEISDAIEGIAEIYARSRLSLADEYGSHLPPQGEILSHRVRHSGLAIRTAGLERTLTTVTEASSSSERLAGGSKAGSVASGKGKVTAYGSLRSIISRGRSSSHSSAPAETPTGAQPESATWSIRADKDAFITIKKQNAAPIQLSLASVAEIPRAKVAPPTVEAGITGEAAPGSQHASASWLVWRRSNSVADEGTASERVDAESALRSVLRSMGG